jgi:hypothetical protein
LLSSCREWEDVWNRFLGMHRTWWHRYQDAGPAYLLPAQVLRRLQSASSGDAIHHTRPAVISLEDASAENAFRETCRQYSSDTTGVWDGRPISFGLLSPPLPALAIAPELLETWNRNGASHAMVERVLQSAAPQCSQVQRRLLGFAGYLNCNKQYQSEKRMLQDRWSRLREPPTFPFLANTHDQPPQYVTPVPSDPSNRWQSRSSHGSTRRLASR